MHVCACVLQIPVNSRARRPHQYGSLVRSQSCSSVIMLAPCITRRPVCGTSHALHKRAGVKEASTQQGGMRHIRTGSQAGGSQQAAGAYASQAGSMQHGAMASIALAATDEYIEQWHGRPRSLTVGRVPPGTVRPAQDGPEVAGDVHGHVEEVSLLRVEGPGGWVGPQAARQGRNRSSRNTAGHTGTSST